MPQLMPLWWGFSVFMLIFLVMMGVILYFFYCESYKIEDLKSYVNKEMWMW